jgi:hypothetical protein
MVFLADYMPYFLADESQPFHFVNGALVPIKGNFTDATPTEAVWYFYLGV